MRTQPSKETLVDKILSPSESLSWDFGLINTAGIFYSDKYFTGVVREALLLVEELRD